MKRGPLAVRLGGAAIGLAAFFAFSYLLMPREVDVTVQLPEAVSALDVRVVALEDGAEAFRGRRTRPEPGRSMLFSMTLPRGEYRLTAWPRGGEALEGTFRVDDEDHLEVEVAPR